MIDVIRHEYAHYYVDVAHLERYIGHSRRETSHGDDWKWACKMVGADPTRCHNNSDSISKKWSLTDAIAAYNADDVVEFDATNLIAETFEERGVKFDVVSHHGIEQLLAGFSVDCGPNVIMRFISRDNDNDVAAGIFGLITNTPTEKRARVMEACNVLNHKIRYMKFYLDTDGDINVEYDFPMHSPDNGIGEMAFEIFARMMHILKSEYSIFMKALYSEEELDIRGHSIPAELMQRLQELRKMMEAQMTAAGVSDDEESDGESDDVKLDLDNLELVSSSDDIAC